MTKPKQRLAAVDEVRAYFAATAELKAAARNTRSALDTLLAFEKDANGQILIRACMKQLDAALTAWDEA